MSVSNTVYLYRGKYNTVMAPGARMLFPAVTVIYPPEKIAYLFVVPGIQYVKIHNGPDPEYPYRYKKYQSC